MDVAALRFARSHEWVHLEGDTATVGITAFAVEALTDLVFVDLPQPGRALASGEIFGEVESVKAVSDLYAPMAGEVIEVNDQLADDLDALSEDPYGRGWMIRIKATDPSSIENLLNEASYREHCASADH